MNAAIEPVVTKSELISGLRAIGVEPGQTIMFHVSIKAIGWIIGGPDVLIEALLECLQDKGTIMMYAGWEERPEHFDRWSAERQRAFLIECPPFVPERSRANRKWSILTEYLRTWPGACRSGNPGASMVAVGARAQWLTANHALQYGYGPESPLGKLCNVDGQILQIGVSPGTATLIHHAEHLARLPRKRKFSYRVPMYQGNAVKWIEIQEYDTSRGIVEWEGGDYLETIAAEFRRTGKGCAGKIGGADSYFCKARDLRDFALAWLEDHFA
jgi:aminoglycoside 3-N-acetyltransferase